MRRRGRRIAIAAGLAGLVALGWWSWSKYAVERRALDKAIAQRVADIEARELEMDALSAVRREFDKLTAVSVGGTEEEGNAAVRRALNEMAAFVGLRKAQVATGAAKPATNPASKHLARQFRGTPDFFTISATLTGEASLEQAVRTLALLEAQDWVCRIEQFGMHAFGGERGINLAVTVTAMFVPGRKSTLGADSAGRIWSPIEEAALDPWRTIVSKNIFREPPPPPPVPAPAPPTVVAQAPDPPPAAPQPSLADWRVTAVAKGRSGPELWLVNEITRETRVLSTGAQVLEAVFVSGAGESARIRIGQEDFEVRLGGTLAERKPAS